MKKTFCLILSLLFILTLLAGCNDAAFVTDPAGESEGIAAGSPSKIESETSASTPSAPAAEPTPTPEKSPVTPPKPSYSELPFPIEEVYFPFTEFFPDAIVNYDSDYRFANAGIHVPEEMQASDQIVLFQVELYHMFDRFKSFRSDCDREEGYIDDIGNGTLKYDDAPLWIKEVYFDEQGQPDPQALEDGRARVQYAKTFSEHVLEIGGEAAALEAKADWIDRCKEKGITYVDTGDPYLYVFCSHKQLMSLIRPIENRLQLYLLSPPENYLRDRKHIVN